MRVLSVMWVLIFLSIPCYVSANVTGMGSMSWSAQVAQDYTNSYHAGSINNDFNQRLYLTEDNGMYEGSLTDGFNSISARVNKSEGIFAPGDISGEVTAQSNSPGSTGSAGVDVVSSFMYYGTLSSLSYSYNFSGQKDSFGDNLTFMIQTEVDGYIDGTGWITLYSDYRGNPLPVRFDVNDFNKFSVSGVFDYPSVSFSEYEQLNVRLDFMIYADDYLPQNVVVPLPPSILLFGAGMLGLVGIGIRRKSS